MNGKCFNSKEFNQGKIQGPVLSYKTTSDLFRSGGAVRRAAFLFGKGEPGDHHGGAVHDPGDAALFPVRHVREERATAGSHLIQKKFIRPKVRIYRTNNLYSALVRQSQLEQEVKRIARKGRKTGKA